MLTFWLLALVLIAVSFALLLPAFWGSYQRQGIASVGEQNIALARQRLKELKQQRDDRQIEEPEYLQQRQELEQSLAYDLENLSNESVDVNNDKNIVHILGIVFFIPAVTFILYFVLGEPESLFKHNQAMQQTNQASSPSPNAPHSIDEMMALLESKLQANPNNPKGWMMLGRSYMSTDQFEKAADVFAKMSSLFGENDVVLLAEADARAMMQNGSMEGKPASLVKKALKLNPRNTTGLWLAGIAAREGGDLKAAISYWERAASMLGDDPSASAKLRQLINNTERELGIAVSAPPAMQQAPAQVAQQENITSGSVAEIRVHVELADDWKNKVSPADTVFVYAKAKQGPPMPLAIVRKQVSDLPLDVTLSDAQAMMPGMSISRFEEVVVSARVSKSGQAMTQPGDISSEKAVVKPADAASINLKINSLVQ